MPVRLNSFDPIRLDASPRWDSSTRSTGVSPAMSAPWLSTCKQVAAWCSICGESEEHSAGALSVVGPEVGRLLEPLMSHPSELLVPEP
jgi:hypothetical protein